MDKREKVIKGLECCIDDKCGVECPYWNDVGNCRLNMESDALALLKAMEPVKPTIGRCEEYDGHDSWWYQCGKCEKPIDWQDNYCRHCGKPVEWDG